MSSEYKYLIMVEDLVDNNWTCLCKFDTLEDATRWFCRNIEPVKKLGHHMNYHIVKSVCYAELI